MNTRLAKNTHILGIIKTMAEVSYICKRTAVSTKPVVPGKFYFFSILDRLMEQNHIRIVYYFQTPKGRKAGEVTKKLRESLSETLTSYPVMTGRMLKNQEGHWMIKSNDAGVRMVEARAAGNVEDWLKRVDREKELMLIHWEEMPHEPQFWSTFYVQLTEFEKGGVAIGLSCTHLLADPATATMFIKAWADTTLGGKITNPLAFHSLPQRRPGNRSPCHKPCSNLINYYKSAIQRTSLVKRTRYATMALAFTDPMVRACMAMARSDKSTPLPSPFEALSGLFWVCISMVKGVKDGLLSMAVGLDMRKELGLDDGFFGNCMIYNRVQTDSLEDHKLPDAIKATRTTVAKMNSEGIMDLIDWLENNNDHCRSPALMNRCDLICASLECGNPYLAMFEEGFAPIRVSYYVEPVHGLGQVLILPPPLGEGLLNRVVMVTLPEDELSKLCRDDLILQFSPTILMGN